MKLFDLHCDTLYELYKRRLPFDNDILHIRTETAAAYEKQVQVFAVWSEHSLTEEEAWRQYLAINEYRKELIFPDNVTPILGIEGGKLLAGDIRRLQKLREYGVSVLTLVWQDQCCMGGAWNTGDGLSPFGADALRECFSLGIHPDLSHSSDAMFFDAVKIAEKAGKPLIASHSCSRSVYAHPRNLTDEMASILFSMGGVVGLSLAPQHLGEKGNCKIERVLRHLWKYLELGGEDHLCFGCDFDGVSTLPEGIPDGGGMIGLRDAMLRAGFGETLCRKILYENAAAFFDRNGVRY